jgi:hypothetical protein
MADSAAETTETQEESSAATETAAAATETRVAVPSNKVPPIGLKNELIKRGLAPKDTKPQTFYTFVNNPGKNDPFPVVHVDENGEEHDSKGGPDGRKTRPVLDLEEGVEWWKRRIERIKNKGTQATSTEGTAQAAAASAPVAEVDEEAAQQAAEDEVDEQDMNVDEAE